MYPHQTIAYDDELTHLRKELESSRAEMHKYKDAYEHSPDMLVSTDPQTAKVVDCNHTLYQKLGYEGKSDIIGKSITELYHPAYRHKFRQALVNFESEGVVENFELALNTRTGKELHVLLNITAVRDQNNNIIRSRSSWTDVSKLKQAQHLATKAQQERESVEKSLLHSRSELNQSHLFSKVMSELNADGWWDWDLVQPENYFISDGLKQLLGYEVQDIPNSLTWIHENTHPEELDAIKAVTHHHLIDDEPYYLQARLRCKDGSYKWFVYRGCAIKDESDRFYRVIGTFNDITTLKETEASLRTKNEELSQFGYRTSHDLKSPLVAISALTECIILDIQDGEIDEARENLQKIKESSKNLTKLVTDIMELSRADLADEEETEIDIDEIFTKLQKTIAESDSAHPVRLTCSNLLSEPFRSQSGRLWQVLYNLVSNSVKYANRERDDSFVDLCFSATEQGPVIDIRDNGVGIPEKFHAKLFQRFQRFHPQLAQGSGLGLSIVKSNIDRLSARINFDSSADGTHYCIAFAAIDFLGKKP